MTITQLYSVFDGRANSKGEIEQLPEQIVIRTAVNPQNLPTFVAGVEYQTVEYLTPL
jgi:hypothetical protein